MRSNASLGSSDRLSKSQTIQNDYKVVVLGVASVGKSSITLVFVNGIFSPEYNPTLQDTFRKPFVLDDQPGTLEILDTAGQEEYVVMQDHWIKEGKGYVVVYSVDLLESFEEVSKIRKRIERVKDTKDFPMIIVGNKCDLMQERKVFKDAGEDLAKQFNCLFMETSAKKKVNCTEVFMELVKDIRRREKKTGKKEEKKSFWKELKEICNLI